MSAKHQPTLFAEKALPYPMPTKELCEELNAYETPQWAIHRLIEHEYSQCLTTQKRSRKIRVLDPCYGMGAIAKAIRNSCKNRHIEIGDIANWCNHGTNYFHLGDFLDSASADWVHFWTKNNQPWDCIMNPPFKISVEFINRALELGANKVCVFEKASFFGAKSRRNFWDNAPLTKILYCAQRANCKRFDLINEDMSSTTHDHAWFVFEPKSKRLPKQPIIERVYR